MPITNGYATLAELKARLGISDTVDDAILEAVITAASRAIDDQTNRVFYTTDEARYFTPASPEVCLVDDLLSVSSLKTDEDGDRTYETTWAATDYDLAPYNATPHWRLIARPAGAYAFPMVPRGVEVTGTWGYAAATPAPIAEACLLLAARLFKRKDAPMGTMGSPEIGIVRIPKIDPDVAVMLEPYRKRRLR